MGIYKYLFCLAIIVLLSACENNPLDLATSRSILAKENDELSRCKIYAKNDKFMANQKLYNDFLQQDNECKVFPEKNPKCLPFLNAPNYAKLKYSYSEIVNLAQRCDDLVFQKTGFTPLLDYKNNKIIKGILRFFNVNLDKKWNELILTFNAKINIATVAPEYAEKEFRQGIELAIQQINQEGGVLGRTIELTRYVEQGDIEQSKKIAKKITNDIELVAVIGLQDSTLTKPATQIYERGGILHLITSATNTDIIRPGMKFNFRMIPNNIEIGQETAEFCKKNNYQDMAILMERNDYAEELGKAFYDASLELGIKINYSKSFFGSKSDFLDIISELSEKKIDAIYFSGWDESAAKFIVQIRNMGINIPVIAPDSLDTENFIQLAGSKGEGIVIPSIYSEKSAHIENKIFLRTYREKYGVNPNTWAAQGYDSVKLLVSTMSKIKSTIPYEVASGLRFGSTWIGAGGDFTFSKDGELMDKEIFFKKLHLGEYEIID